MKEVKYQIDPSASSLGITATLVDMWHVWKVEPFSHGENIGMRVGDVMVSLGCLEERYKKRQGKNSPLSATFFSQCENDHDVMQLVSHERELALSRGEKIMLTMCRGMPQHCAETNSLLSTTNHKVIVPACSDYEDSNSIKNFDELRNTIPQEVKVLCDCRVITVCSNMCLLPHDKAFMVSDVCQNVYDSLEKACAMGPNTQTPDWLLGPRTRLRGPQPFMITRSIIFAAVKLVLQKENIQWLNTVERLMNIVNKNLPRIHCFLITWRPSLALNEKILHCYARKIKSCFRNGLRKAVSLSSSLATSHKITESYVHKIASHLDATGACPKITAFKTHANLTPSSSRNSKSLQNIKSMIISHLCEVQWEYMPYCPVEEFYNVVDKVLTRLLENYATVEPGAVDVEEIKDILDDLEDETFFLTKLNGELRVRVSVAFERTRHEKTTEPVDEAEECVLGEATKTDLKKHSSKEDVDSKGEEECKDKASASDVGFLDRITGPKSNGKGLETTATGHLDIYELNKGKTGRMMKVVREGTLEAKAKEGIISKEQIMASAFNVMDSPKDKEIPRNNISKMIGASLAEDGRAKINRPEATLGYDTVVPNKDENRKNGFEDGQNKSREIDVLNEDYRCNSSNEINSQTNASLTSNSVSSDKLNCQNAETQVSELNDTFPCHVVREKHMEKEKDETTNHNNKRKNKEPSLGFSASAFKSSTNTVQKNKESKIEENVSSSLREVKQSKDGSSDRSKDEVVTSEAMQNEVDSDVHFTGANAHRNYKDRSKSTETPSESGKNVNSRVFAKFTNGVYYWGKIEMVSLDKRTKKNVYMVIFDDGDVLGGLKDEHVLTAEDARKKKKESDPERKLGGTRSSNRLSRKSGGDSTDEYKTTKRKKRKISCV